MPGKYCRGKEAATARGRGPSGHWITSVAKVQEEGKINNRMKGNGDKKMGITTRDKGKEKDTRNMSKTIT